MLAKGNTGNTCLCCTYTSSSYFLSPFPPASNLGEKLVLLLQSGAGGGIYFIFSSRAHDCFRFLHHGSRYNTFCGYPLEIVNKMPKKELAEELLFVNAIRDNTIDPIKDEVLGPLNSSEK
ncbi:hypothetical protein JHK87_027440 [Glycine soja]|nr:hypothetical protein JHK87_027440 [Glycine soja]